MQPLSHFRILVEAEFWWKTEDPLRERERKEGEPLRSEVGAVTGRREGGREKGEGKTG